MNNKVKSIIIFSVVIINILFQLKYLNSGWDQLISRCPVSYAIEAKNIAKFGILHINKSNLYAVGNYGLKREFDVPLCNHPILISVICAVFFKIFGTSVWVTKLLALLFGLGIVILLMLFTQRMFKMQLLVFIAGIVGTVIPIGFYYNHELDLFWLDIFYLLAIIFIYHKAFEENFKNMWLKMSLYAFTLLGCFNGWRIIVIIPLILLHCIFSNKNIDTQNKKLIYKFIKEYIMLFVFIAVCLVLYIRYLYSVDFITYIKNVYLRTEPKPETISISNWLFKYFSIQLNCYTTIIYLSFLFGIWLFFANNKIKNSDKFLMCCIIFWGIITTLFLTNHAYYLYSLHNAFYIPIIFFSSLSLVTFFNLIPTNLVKLKTVTIIIFLIVFIMYSRLTFTSWPFRFFPVRGFEIKINRNTTPDDIIATNVDLTGQHNYTSNIRNFINLHNMFFMDRGIEIFKFKEDFLKSNKKYKYFVFDYNELLFSHAEKELFDYLKNNSVKVETEGKFYIFCLNND